jgi:hypothetical protein
MALRGNFTSIFLTSSNENSLTFDPFVSTVLIIVLDSIYCYATLFHLLRKNNAMRSLFRENTELKILKKFLTIRLSYYKNRY